MDKIIKNLSPVDLAGMFVLIVLIMLCLSFNAVLLAIRKRRLIDRTAKKERELKRRYEREKKTSVFFYNLMSGLPFLRDAVLFLRNGFLNIVPYGQYSLNIKVSSAVLWTGLVSVGAGVMALLENIIATGGAIEYWGIVNVFVAVFIGISEVSFHVLNKCNTEVSEQMLVYMQNVMHYYSCNRTMGTALLDGAEDMSFEIRCHANQIYRMITAENSDDLVYEYVNNRDLNPFLRLFVTQVYKVSEGGDPGGTGTSLFNRNVEKIRRLMMRTNLSSAEKIEAQAGYTFALWLGVFAMNFVKRTALSFDTGLSTFYSSYGLLIQAVTLLVSFVLYRMVNKSKYIVTRRVVRDGGVWEKISNTKVLRRFFKANLKRDTGLKKMLIRTGTNISPRAFVTKSVSIGLATTFIIALLIYRGHMARRNEYLTVVKHESYITAVTESQRNSLNAAILMMVNFYKDRDIDRVSDQVLMSDLESLIELRNRDAKDMALKIVREQVNGYQNEYFMWYEIFLSLTGMLAGAIPYVELLYYDSLTKGEKEDEVRTFQMIVSLEKDLPDVKVIDILTEWESHSILYAEKLRKAILSYSAAPESALYELYDPESQPFSILVDSLLASDVIGIRAAFNELDTNMENDEAMRNHMDVRNFKKRRSLMEFLCYLPFGIVVGGYFLVPFLVSVLKEVGGGFDVLKSLGGGI